MVPFRIVGNPDLKSEDAMSYEMGLRRQATEKFYWDISVYFNRYDNMINVAPPVWIAPYWTYIFQNWEPAIPMGLSGPVITKSTTGGS